MLWSAIMPNLYNFFSPSKVVPLTLGAGAAMYPSEDAEAAMWKKAKELWFHGGPLESPWFNGKTWWTKNIDYADGYRDYDQDHLYAVLIDPRKEKIVDENENLLRDLDDEESWEEQTRQMKKAFDEGATVFASDDGWALDHRGRRVRKIKLPATVTFPLVSQYEGRTGEAKPVGWVQQFFQSKPVGQFMTGLARSGAETGAAMLNNLNAFSALYGNLNPAVFPTARPPTYQGQPGTQALEYLTARGYIPPPTGSGYETLGSLFAPF